MKSLKDRLFFESTIVDNEEIIDEKKGKQISTKALKQFIQDNEYAIIVDKYRMKQYIFDSYPEYCCYPSEIYILEAGDESIAAKYGQNKYAENRLDGQDIDGTWCTYDNDCSTNKALKELAERTGFKNITKSNNPYKEDDWMVWFYRCEWLEKFMKGTKIFDTRTIVKS